MSKKPQCLRQKKVPQTKAWPGKMKLSQALKFLGVSHAKMTSLIHNGVIPHEPDPLDHRVKLVRKSDLEKFIRGRRRQ
jgi:hypothetical protein